ncbi:MAG: HAD family hydrolase [Paludibacteraceae bacterium]|nr:HAD family hydrolase [Paludibacteraceae bacterium]
MDCTLNLHITRPYRCYIFDLDGTLLNTIADLGAACNHALAACGHPQHPVEVVEKMVGNGINALLLRAMPEKYKTAVQDFNNLPQETETELLRLRKAFIPYYDQHCFDRTAPYPGIVDLLQRLKAEGAFLAVASNKYQSATEAIVSHCFPDMFDVVLGEREGIPRKPDPQIVYDILNRVGVSKSDTLYIGDSLVDISTARNAGLDVRACPWGFTPEPTLLQTGVTLIDRQLDAQK